MCCSQNHIPRVGDLNKSTYIHAHTHAASPLTCTHTHTRMLLTEPHTLRWWLQQSYLHTRTRTHMCCSQIHMPCIGHFNQVHLHTRTRTHMQQIHLNTNAHTHAHTHMHTHIYAAHRTTYHVLVTSTSPLTTWRAPRVTPCLRQHLARLQSTSAMVATTQWIGRCLLRGCFVGLLCVCAFVWDGKGVWRI